MRPTRRQGVAPMSRPRQRTDKLSISKATESDYLDNSSRDEARVEACRLPVDHYIACCSPSWSRDRTSRAFLSSSRQQRPTWKLTWSRCTYVVLCSKQASGRAHACSQPDTAHSPWAPLQALRVTTPLRQNVGPIAAQVPQVSF